MDRRSENGLSIALLGEVLNPLVGTAVSTASRGQAKLQLVGVLSPCVLFSLQSALCFWKALAAVVLAWCEAILVCSRSCQTNSAHTRGRAERG